MNIATPHRLLVVLDTNVLIQLVLAISRLLRFLRQAWQQGHFEVAISPAILDELRRVLRYPRIQETFNLSEDDIAVFLFEIQKRAFLTADLYEVFAVQRDSSDNILLACALESRADYLVTEDNHLRSLKHYHTIQIIGIKQLAEMLGWQA